MRRSKKECKIVNREIFNAKLLETKLSKEEFAHFYNIPLKTFYAWEILNNYPVYTELLLNTHIRANAYDLYQNDYEEYSKLENEITELINENKKLQKQIESFDEFKTALINSL
ncbi:hypothetical protein [Campylobacter troglodytis]|uniref:hypothetical protein n=1 Tax=Campylobacter troglodytis TaxID=654363 RepID=UPI00115BE5AD|nr:hypothetical protein [Campylobacter troglodytis]TQR53188.1 hypothetical protein DMC01_11755 [Campylobacter troglodytis]